MYGYIVFLMACILTSVSPPFNLDSVTGYQMTMYWLLLAIASAQIGKAIQDFIKED